MFGRPITGSLSNRPATSRNNQQVWGNGSQVPNKVISKQVTPQTSQGQVPLQTGARPVTGRLMTGIVPQTGRLMTQHGLSGMKTAVGGGRVIQDRTYWITELRKKINMIVAETTKLNAESERFSKEKENLSIFEKKADSLADELKELQGQLGDLNTLVDKLHVEADLPDLEQAYNQLKTKNEIEKGKLDSVFSSRQQKEQAIKDIESQIEQEKQRIEERMMQLPEKERTDYFKTKEQNSAFNRDIIEKQAELEELNSRAKKLEEELGHDKLKQKAIALHEKINLLKSQQLDLENDVLAREKENQPEVRENLLKKVKEDNLEIANLERKINELEEQSNRLKAQIQQLDLNIEETQDEQNAKYEELSRRDKEMTLFLDNFDQNLEEAKKKNVMLEQKITSLLDKLKKTKMTTNDIAEFIRDDVEQTPSVPRTVEALTVERLKRMQELESLNQLESRLVNELSQLREKQHQQLAEIKRMSNIQEAKKEGLSSKEKYLQEKKKLQQEREESKKKVTEVSSEYEKRRTQLAENETYNHLSAQEQRIRQQENIASKNAELNYSHVACDARNLLSECNGTLQKVLSLPPRI